MIKNTRNGKKYIGSTKNGRSRKNEHFSLLRKGRHHCDYLQHAWNAEEDKSVFQFSMFIYCKKEQLLALEQSCFDHMKPEYNTSLIADRVEMTDETRRKIAAAATGRPQTEEHRKKNSDANSGKNNPMYGRNHTKEARKKISIARTLNPFRGHCPEMYEKIKPKISGENSVHAKLTENDVRDILKSKRPGREMAAKYNVSEAAISNIRNGKSWKHINRKEI